MAPAQGVGLIVIGVAGTLGLLAANVDFGAPKEQPEIVHSTAFLRPARSAEADRLMFAKLAARARCARASAIRIPLSSRTLRSSTSRRPRA